MSLFQTILADPPWRFRNSATRICPEKNGAYKQMPLDSIIGLGEFVRTLVYKNSHLWLCAPNSLVIDGTAELVAKLWGWTPKQLTTIRKLTKDGRPKIGAGNYQRNSTEQVLFCTRGRLAVLRKNACTEVGGICGKHSSKPDELYQHIESVSPGPRLELFARVAREGWRSWGDEAPEETRLERMPECLARNAS